MRETADSRMTRCVKDAQVANSLLTRKLPPSATKNTIALFRADAGPECLGIAPHSSHREGMSSMSVRTFVRAGMAVNRPFIRASAWSRRRLLQSSIPAPNPHGGHPPAALNSVGITISLSFSASPSLKNS